MKHSNTSPKPLKLTLMTLGLITICSLSCGKLINKQPHIGVCASAFPLSMLLKFTINFHKMFTKIWEKQLNSGLKMLQLMSSSALASLTKASFRKPVMSLNRLYRNAIANIKYMQFVVSSIVG